VVDTVSKPVFEMSGDQGNKWISMSAEINSVSIKKSADGSKTEREANVSF